jgi:hypothetical protein
LELVGGVSLNLQQRLAVAALLCGGGVAAPYVLFGPPGTGEVAAAWRLLLLPQQQHSYSSQMLFYQFLHGCAPIEQVDSVLQEHEAWHNFVVAYVGCNKVLMA